MAEFSFSRKLIQLLSHEELVDWQARVFQAASSRLVVIFLTLGDSVF